MSVLVLLTVLLFASAFAGNHRLHKGLKFSPYFSKSFFRKPQIRVVRGGGETNYLLVWFTISLSGGQFYSLSIKIPPDVTQDTEKCGKMILLPSPEGRIVGGNETSYGEFPWMATLQYKRMTTGLDAGMRCAGFVINKKFVMTAAHCLHFDNYYLNSVYLGVRKISNIESTDVDKVRKFEIEKRITHEQYDPITFVNDIALLKLKTEIYYSNYILPICLPDPYAALPQGGTMLVVAGYGLNAKDGWDSDHKLKVMVSIHSHEVCDEKLGHPIRSDQLCAEGEMLKGTCGGDGGAPLMHTVPDGIDLKWTAIGIVSSVNGCGFHGIPFVHTRVSSYIGWINQNVVRA